MGLAGTRYGGFLLVRISRTTSKRCRFFFFLAHKNVVEMVRGVETFGNFVN